MLWKKLNLAFICLLVPISVGLPLNVFASQNSYPFKLSSDSAVLMDANTGLIVYSHNPHQRFQPASLAKVMALFLIFDALERGDVELNNEVVISKNAAQKGGSTMYLREGEKVPLVKLIKGSAVVSGNDASVALAEGVLGSEQDLVDKMNQKLRDLNLQNSKFQTVDGWPVPEQYTTAYDMAMLAYAYIREHPDAIQYHKLTEFTHSDIVLHNRNGLIFQDTSVDGLKTGHVEEAGYHIIATAVREEHRYIAVIMGAEQIETREKEAMQLLNFALNNLIMVRLFNTDEVISHLSVLNGVKDEVGLRPLEDGVVTIPANLKDAITYKLEIPRQQEAPIAKDQSVGQAIILYQKEILKRIPIVANEDIQKAGTGTQVMKSVASFVAEQKILLFAIVVLFCVLALLYLYFLKHRYSSGNKKPSESELVKQRYEKIFKSNDDEE